MRTWLGSARRRWRTRSRFDSASSAGPWPTTRSNPRGLTEREWEIARLLALGLSNGEIADQLVVPPKTVGHHVSAVLAKLAVRRRAEVAAAISEVGAPI
jgi:DNA-binding NarL/FixJ family response regulator